MSLHRDKMYYVDERLFERIGAAHKTYGYNPTLPFTVLFRQELESRGAVAMAHLPPDEQIVVVETLERRATVVKTLGRDPATSDFYHKLIRQAVHKALLHYDRFDPEDPDDDVSRFMANLARSGFHITRIGDAESKSPKTEVLFAEPESPATSYGRYYEMEDLKDQVAVVPNQGQSRFEFFKLAEGFDTSKLVDGQLMSVNDKGEVYPTPAGATS